MCFIKTTLRASIVSSFIVISGLIASCASVPQSQALRQVRVGMTKSDVLGLIGNPTRTERRHSQDRWTYEVSGNESDATTYIFFSEGRVTYIGDAKESDTATSSIPTAPDVAPKKPTGEGFHPVE